ncbi:MAG: RNA polymerase sigma factor [Planctomycetota bacterium]
MQPQGAPDNKPNPVDAGPQHRLTPEQFAELFVAEHARLWGLASALVNDRSEAEDLVQEAAMVGLKKLDQFTPETNFLAWMARIVRMHAANFRRKRAGRRTSAADPVDIDQSQAAPAAYQAEPRVSDSAAGETRTIQEGFDDTLLSNLQRLDETPRACLLLRVVHELAYDEIAAMLEIPSGTAMSHVHRAKKRLRDEMASRVTPQPNYRES